MAAPRLLRLYGRRQPLSPLPPKVDFPIQSPSRRGRTPRHKSASNLGRTQGRVWPVPLSRDEHRITNQMFTDRSRMVVLYPLHLEHFLCQPQFTTNNNELVKATKNHNEPGVLHWNEACPWPQDWKNNPQARFIFPSGLQ